MIDEVKLQPVVRRKKIVGYIRRKAGFMSLPWGWRMAGESRWQWVETEEIAKGYVLHTDIERCYGEGDQ